MNTCKNCKWWGREYANTCDAPQSDILSVSKRKDDWFPHTEHSVKNSAGFSIYANADDDQGLTASLITGPDFGCVQFQPKDQT